MKTKLFKHDVAKILKDGQRGDYTLSHFTIDKDDFRAIRGGVTPNKEYIKLSRNGNVVMSNTQMEKFTNQEILYKANGDVLIGGLGIGMILLELQDNPKVKSITVVELSDDVIELVGRQLPLNDKVKIISKDIFEAYKDFKPESFDIIYFDIWDYVDDEARDQMGELEDAYYPLLKQSNPHNYINSWLGDFEDFSDDYARLWIGFDD